MPLTIVQQKTGSLTANGNLTLDAGTTAGTTLLAILGIGSTTSLSTLTGFTRDGQIGATNAKVEMWRKSNVAGGESSWAVTFGTPGGPVSWAVFEVEGLDNDAPVDVKPDMVATYTNTATFDTYGGTSNPASTTYDGLVVAVHVAYIATTSPPTLTSHTQGLVEVAEQQTANATVSVDLSVSMLFTQTPTTWEVSATRSDGAVGNSGAYHIVYTAAGAKRAADLRDMYGMEWLSSAGLVTGNAGNRVFNSLVGTPTIGSNPANARTGNGYLELPATATIDSVTTAALAIASTDVNQCPVVRVCFRFVGGLPAADTDLFAVATSLATVRYRQASGKLGVTCGAGTEVLSDATVTADTWIAVDFRVRDTGAAWQADWWVTYDATPGASSAPVVQTSATWTTASGITTYSLVLGRLAAPASAPPLIRYDDVVQSITRGHHPLGDHQIIGLPPDPAGTITLGGGAVAADFNTFTANGTLAAWNAAAALAAIDDLPPTIGASADGLAQVIVGATDYVEIPMETDQAAPLASIRGVKMYACGWASGTAATTIGFRAHDGTTEHTLFAAADPAFDNSTTVPAWVCKMIRTTAGGKILWTQALLDALVMRVGFSTDVTATTVGVGIHSIVNEVAVQPTERATPLFGEAATGDILVTAAVDPVTGAIVGLDVATPPGLGGTLTYEISGTPTSVYVPPSDTDTQVIDTAVDSTTVNSVTWAADPEPEQY